MVDGLRERKKAETRTALRDAALRLADQHGLDKVSVDAIADAAGVSTRTFFNYFPSKEDAIIGMAPSMPSPVIDHLRGRAADEAPLEALRAAIQASVEHLHEDPDRWVIRRRLVEHHPELAARYAARLAEMERDLVVELAKRLGLDPDHHTYPATAVGAALAATRVAMTIWQGQDTPTSLDRLLDQVFDQLASGLAPS
ncbi:MAG: TetR/AcrR family transcriptional regulator [Acidimicrobiales bacterium]